MGRGVMRLLIIVGGGAERFVKLRVLVRNGCMPLSGGGEYQEGETGVGAGR